ncbi:YrhB domain-containing protein [Streptomyces chartreusis]
MISEADGRLIAESFLSASRMHGEPELAINWNAARVKEGILIGPYNSAQYLATRSIEYHLLDCWPILVDLSSGEARFGKLEEMPFWGE